MFAWTTRINTLGAFTNLPRLTHVAEEIQYDRNYHLWGRLRTKETHALFKYTLSGTGAIKDANGEHLVPKGHGFLCEINDPAIEYYYPESSRGPWRFIWVTFNGDCAIRWVQDLVKNGGPIFRIPEESGIIEHILSFGKKQEDHRVIQPDWSAEFVLSLLLALTRTRETKTSDIAPRGLVRRVQELVANNLDQNINGKLAADQLRVSREHLSRVFHQETGMTLHQYIVRQKMDYACHLLRYSEDNSKEIAIRLGYESPAHFGRTFRRIMGMTPGDFRSQGGLH